MTYSRLALLLAALLLAEMVAIAVGVMRCGCYSGGAPSTGNHNVVPSTSIATQPT